MCVYYTYSILTQYWYIIPMDIRQKQTLNANLCLLLGSPRPSDVVAMGARLSAGGSASLPPPPVPGTFSPSIRSAGPGQWDALSPSPQAVPSVRLLPLPNQASFPYVFTNFCFFLSRLQRPCSTPGVHSWINLAAYFPPHCPIIIARKPHLQNVTNT